MFDVGNNSGNKSSVSNFTFSSPSIGSLTEGVLVVTVQARGASSDADLRVSSITHNGNALTYATNKLVSGSPSSTSLNVEAWYILAPTSGVHNIVVTFVGTVDVAVAYASSYSGINQTTPINATAGSGTFAGTNNVTLCNITTTVDNCTLVDALYNKIGTSLTKDSSQTLISAELFPNGGGDTADASYKEGVSIGSNSMSWLYTGQDSDAQVVIALAPSATGALPSVSTTSVTSITTTSASLQGSIGSIGDSAVTIRGFDYGVTPESDKVSSTTGSYSTGAYSQTVTGLNIGTTYYYRAFATNSIGTSYGDWLTFTTTSSQYSITIDGNVRTGDILNQTLVIEDVLNDKQNTCSFALVDLSGNGIPSEDQEIIITGIDGVKLFAGYIVKIDIAKKGMGMVTAYIECVDYVRLFDRNLVHKSYTAMTDSAIIEDIVSTYCSGLDITTDNVTTGVTINQISFNYVQPSQALRRICDLTGRNWFIDYDKDIHYFPTTTDVSPFNIDSSNNEYSSLKITKNSTQIKNRIYVRGGTELSDPTTYSVKGDGIATKFPIPDKPHNVSITINGVSKTLGIKNIDTSGYDWYLNFQEKYVEQDSGGIVLTTTDSLVLTYEYDIPILVAQENPTSIAEHGVQEFAIFDKSISTTTSARDRATAELTDYANRLIEGSFQTYTTGFKSGQYININLTEYDVNADYIVQKVIGRSLGSGVYVYDVSIASAKTMGIIRFLIELLEANKNLIELDENEVVDELFSLTDALLSDSLIDSLTIDSMGAYATWCTDSLDSSPITRAVWNLWQWG